MRSDKKKLKILLISHERKLGGATRSLIALAQQLEKRGHQVYVVVLLRNCPLAKVLREKGIKLVPIFFGWWMCPEYWGPVLKGCFKVLYWLEIIAVKYLVRIVKKYQIDIIHSNSSTIDIGAKVAERTNRKHFWHFREFGLEDFQLEYMKGRSESLKYVEDHAHGIIFISKRLREAYQDIKCKQKVRVIYNGISQDYLQKKQYEIRDQIRFLVSGTIVQNKNQMLAVKAARRLAEQGYKNFIVQVVGTSTSLKASQEYERQMKEYIAEHSLEEQIVMMGYRADMKTVRSQAEIEIIVSRSEAFGRVTVEAMMSSMPVIAADAGANPEIVTHGETGYLFESDNVEELANAMKQFLENPGNIKIMGEKAYHFAKEKFTAEKNAEEIEGFYYEMLE